MTVHQILCSSNQWGSDEYPQPDSLERAVRKISAVHASFLQLCCDDRFVSFISCSHFCVFTLIVHVALAFSYSRAFPDDWEKPKKGKSGDGNELAASFAERLQAWRAFIKGRHEKYIAQVSKPHGQFDAIIVEQFYVSALRIHEISHSHSHFLLQLC